MNTSNQYGLVAKLFHWLIGLTMIAMLCLGLYMQGLPGDAPNRFDLYGWHKIIGLLTLSAVLGRICWALINFGRPHPLATHARWEVFLAKSVHVLLYLLMIAVPLSGWVMSSAYGFPVKILGFEFSVVGERDLTLAGNAKNAHWILGYVIMGVIALHVMGALKHVFIDKDNTLRRMIFCRSRSDDV